MIFYIKIISLILFYRTLVRDFSYLPYFNIKII